MMVYLCLSGYFCVLVFRYFVYRSYKSERGTDHEHPPLSLEEVLAVSDASLDLVASLNVCVVYVSPALQQHVSHEKHQRTQLLLFLHYYSISRDATLT